MCIVLAVLFWSIVFMAIIFSEMNKKETIILIIITLIIALLIGGYFENYMYQRTIIEFTTQKETIEQAMRNEKISDLEKVNLVTKICEINSQLEKDKVTYNQLYFFFLNREDINRLEKINLQFKEWKNEVIKWI